MDVIIKHKPVTIPILPIVMVLIVVVVLFMTVSVGRIQGNQIGVLVNNLTGSIDVRQQTGALVYNGLLTDFYVLDNTTQTIRMAGQDQINIKTAEGADVRMDVEVNYRLVQDPTVIEQRVIPECGLGTRREYQSGRDDRSRMQSERVDSYKVKWIRDYCRTVIRYTFGELRAGDFYVAARRDEKARESEAELNRLLNPHGLHVVKVVPDEFHFYPEYELIIANKKAADQEVENQSELAKKALEEQKKEETEARALATVEIATMEGELEKQRLAAEAEADAAVRAGEAYAITAKKGADAAFYKANNDAQSRLAVHQAEAQGMQQLVTSLEGAGGTNLVKLEYAKALANARISGVPYATDPRIQKVEVSGTADATAKKIGGAQQ